MDSPTQSATISAASQSPPPDSESKKEMLHRTKVVQFLGRTAPIILQNDNGPCPLLAICNVLSLKNNLNLSSDVPEISQEKLLSLVAERLIDSNINLNSKADGYAENQQQNISDAIDLLPRLATGIDVNIKFRRIDDFEFTPECAIFDLLDIPLYHGWIVDPQDLETSNAIGSKSYNTLMGELVSLETQNSVDFVASTTATLGVPSPSLSRGQSFEDSPCRSRKGDIEEEAELLKALRLSEAEISGSSEDNILVADLTSSEHKNVNRSDEVTNLESVDNSDTNGTVKNLILMEATDADTQSSVVLLDGMICSASNNDNRILMQPTFEDGKPIDTSVDSDVIELRFSNNDSPTFDPSLVEARYAEDFRNAITGNSNGDETEPHPVGGDENGLATSFLDEKAELDSSASGQRFSDKRGAFSSCIDIGEPMYEGEECILESNAAVDETREPIYEGEVVLAEQVDKGELVESSNKSKDGISLKEGEIIRSFMKNSASQLTVYGLFCLQDKVKERELCVFFRNNHFNTMFKYEGNLYILATDQGFINQPDLVWEKLNEVNGDTVFVTGKFENFKMDDESSSVWEEHHDSATAADYLANVDSTQANPSFNSDLQLAMALQQQEYDEQHEHRQGQRSNKQHQPPSSSGSSGGGSRLVTGPQVSGVGGSSSSSSKPSKEKCIVM